VPAIEAFLAWDRLAIFFAKETLLFIGVKKIKIKIKK